MNEEIVSAKRNEAFYQVADSIFSINITTKKESLVYIFPADFKGDITTINADGTLLGGVWATDEEKDISKKNPQNMIISTKYLKQNCQEHYLQ
jgi:oligogalacturonide lyase